MPKSLKELALLALTASLWTLPAAGQGAAPAPAESAPPPAPAPGAKPAADDDLELPAKPASSAAPAPSATPPASASPPSPVAPSAAAGSASAAATAGGNAHAGAGATAATAAPEKDKAAAQGDAKQAVEKKSAWPEGLRVGGYIQAQYETDGSTVRAGVNLSSQNGSTGDNYLGTVFDADAATPIGDGAAPFTGTFSSTG